MAFRKKSYQEIVDDVLTDLTGGVVDEAHTYVEGTTTYQLARSPVRLGGIVSIRGTVSDGSYIFASTDYQLTGEETLEWIGIQPDTGTHFYVNYYPADAASPITDRNIGSVTRTVVEAFSREMATLYAQLEKTYLAAFVDTAEDRSLEFVVSILGMERILAGRAVGTVEFSRGTPALGDITIPLGTIASDREDNRYETTEEATLRQGQLAVEVSVRAVSEDVPPVAARSLILMPRPVVGVEKVTNFEATTRGTKDESDEELRARAKAALYGAGKATVEAIRFAVLGQGVNSVVIHDMPQDVPGELDLIIDFGGGEEQEQGVKQAVNATRAAGIRVNFNRTQRVDIALELTVTLAAELLEEEKRALERSIRRQIGDYIVSLGAGEKVLGNQLVALAMADPRVQDVSIEPSGDISVGRREKANVEETAISVEFVAAPAEVPPEEVPTGPTPIQVEASIYVAQVAEAFVSAIGQLSEAQDQIRAIIEAKVQAYFAERFAGDSICFVDFLNAMASEKYILDEGQTQLRNTHVLDGLVVTLSEPDDTDWIRESEQVKLVVVNVIFG
jgi:uncharacterized phage protein gp47/JayE